MLLSPAVKFVSWVRRLLGLPVVTEEADNLIVERPWLGRWEHIPRRSAGWDFTRADYAVARQRAREVARATLGEECWADL